MMMTTRKTVLALLLVSAVGVTPAYANYFSNPRTGTMLNIGSAPNPTPADLRAIGDAAPPPPPAQSQNTYQEAAPLPPAPPPAAEPPAPLPQRQAELPPPQMRKFMVFFDFDKSNLTPEARDIVDRAARIARGEGRVEIMIVGHTDTVGSRAYNQKLSERRARSVKREMVKQGLLAQDIMTKGVNFQDPLVPTGPGVREPQNRRAVINLGTGPVASTGTYGAGPNS
jgi:outer membrane protein OmpA-like peptidoglycan-associated protein